MALVTGNSLQGYGVLKENPSWNYPSGSLYLCSGTATEPRIQSPINGRTFLACPSCGRKFLFVEKNITTPTFDLSCTCGSILEIEEEKQYDCKRA